MDRRSSDERSESMPEGFNRVEYYLTNFKTKGLTYDECNFMLSLMKEMAVALVDYRKILQTENMGYYQFGEIVLRKFKEWK